MDYSPSAKVPTEWTCGGRLWNWPEPRQVMDTTAILTYKCPESCQLSDTFASINGPASFTFAVRVISHNRAFAWWKQHSQNSQACYSSYAMYLFPTALWCKVENNDWLGMVWYFNYIWIRISYQDLMWWLGLQMTRITWFLRISLRTTEWSAISNTLAVFVPMELHNPTLNPLCILGGMRQQELRCGRLDVLQMIAHMRVRFLLDIVCFTDHDGHLVKIDRYFQLWSQSTRVYRHRG